MPKISSKITADEKLENNPEISLKASPKPTVRRTTRKTVKKVEENQIQPVEVDQDNLLENSESKIESYVPRITHFKTTKKEPNQMSDNTQPELENKENNSPEISKLETLKKNFKDLNKIGAKTESNSRLSKSAQSNLNEIKSQNRLSESLDSTIINPTPAEISTKSQFQIPQIGKASNALPSFLNKGFRQNKPSAEVASPQSSAQPQSSANESHNSLTSIFTRDKDEIGNIKRVFRKSIIFLTLALLTFGLSSLASSNFGLQSMLTLLFTSFGFIALTNIFFIIVAHRTYVWLFLLGQFIILSITQYPFSVSLSTLVIGLATVLLTYLAYLDLEKVQLGSRLFSIPYIVGESTKILSTVIILIVCLSTFNQIEAKGVDKFIGDSVLSVPIVLDKAVLPLYQTSYLKGVNLDFSKDDNNTTVKTLICAERKLNCDTKNRSVLSQDEYAKIQSDCKTNGTGESGCEAIVEAAQTVVLNDYLNQDLSGLGLTISTKLNSDNYQTILKQLVQNKIKSLADPAKLNFLPSSVPAKSVIPFTISLLLLVLLSIFKFIFVWMGYIVTWIFWKLLQVTGFVRLDIEMVEAEIVGI